MKDVKDYLVEMLHIIDLLIDRYKIEYDEENKYYSAIVNFKKYLVSDNVELTKAERDWCYDYLESLEIPNLQNNINAIFDVPNDDGTYSVNHSLNELSDNQLLDYLMDVYRGISLIQHNNLICAKYGIAVWNTGFHNLAKFCRGRIIDTNDMSIVSHPFDKFFNLNEVPETKDTLIQHYIDESTYIYATDKKDGSTIIVSRYHGKPLITTNGSFDNDQIKWAKELFDEKYPSFLPNLKDGYTYIFELIHPENKIVIDYGDERSLYMLSIRDLANDDLVSLDEIHSVANEYGFPYPEVYDFKDLDTMVNLAHSLKGSNREGWVLRIGTPDGEKMVKLKLDEYFAMHKAFGKITPIWVYKHLCFGDLDDYLALVNQYQKESIFEALDIINATRAEIKKNSIALANSVLEKYGIRYDEYAEDYNRMVTIVQDLIHSKNLYSSYAIQYLKDINHFETIIDTMRVKNFKVFYKMYNEV